MSTARAKKERVEDIFLFVPNEGLLVQHCMLVEPLWAQSTELAVVAAEYCW